MPKPPRIPNPVAVVVGQVLGKHYYNHHRLNTLFIEKGAPGDPPPGNCELKCTDWLKRVSADDSADASKEQPQVLGSLQECRKDRG